MRDCPARSLSNKPSFCRIWSSARALEGPRGSFRQQHPARVVEAVLLDEFSKKLGRFRRKIRRRHGAPDPAISRHGWPCSASNSPRFRRASSAAWSCMASGRHDLRRPSLPVSAAVIKTSRVSSKSQRITASSAVAAEGAARAGQRVGAATTPRGSRNATRGQSSSSITPTLTSQLRHADDEQAQRQPGGAPGNMARVLGRARRWSAPRSRRPAPVNSFVPPPGQPISRCRAVI